MTWTTNLTAWFGVGEDWERTPPASWRGDVILMAALVPLALIDVVIIASLGELESPWWSLLTVQLAGVAALLFRRRAPLAVALFGGVSLIVAGYLVPEAPFLLVLQFAGFFAMFSGVAWARDRTLLVIVAALDLVIVFGWLLWVYAVGDGIDQILTARDKPTHTGPLTYVQAIITRNVITNVAYYCGAIAAGQIAWRRARQEALVTQQATQLATQAEQLRDQAVTDERLRIAHELHDVVAHHVSVMGIQAAGARRVLNSDPGAAAEALKGVEDSSRRAVTEMRDLLGTLRSGTADTRDPGPALAQLPALVADAEQPNLSVSYALVDPTNRDDDLPAPVALTLYRVAQEALANVRRHSTARRATVTVRLGSTAEVEVIDDGSPRLGTSGSGLGHEGIRERVAALGGTHEIGPRPLGGYRVRAILPLPPEETT